MSKEILLPVFLETQTLDKSTWFEIKTCPKLGTGDVLGKDVQEICNKSQTKYKYPWTEQKQICKLWKWKEFEVQKVSEEWSYSMEGVTKDI